MRRSAKTRALFLVACLVSAVYGMLTSPTHANADHFRTAPSRSQAARENQQLRNELAAERSAHAALRQALERVVALTEQERGPLLGARVRQVAAEALGRRLPGPHARARYHDASLAARKHTPGSSRHPWGTKIGLSDADVADLVQRVSAAFPDRERLELLDMATRDRVVSVAQASALLRACSFDRSRIEVAVLLHPRLVDPQNAYRLADAFDFRASFRELQQRVSL